MTRLQNSPVSQRHALEQPGESGVDAQAPRVVPVGLAPRPVHRVEVVPLRAAALPAARRRVAVRRRHHEVSAVDHLGAGERAGRGSDSRRTSRTTLRFRVRLRGVLQLAPRGRTHAAVSRHGMQRLCGFPRSPSSPRWTILPEEGGLLPAAATAHLCVLGGSTAVSEQTVNFLIRKDFTRKQLGGSLRGKGFKMLRH